jgi:hypothetical protein
MGLRSPNGHGCAAKLPDCHGIPDALCAPPTRLRSPAVKT